MREVPKSARQVITIGLDLAIVAVLGLTVWIALDRDRPPVTGADLIGHRPPTLTLEDAGGRPVPYEPADSTGSLLLVFRSDCPVCQAQREDWQRIARAAAGLGIAVVAVTPEALTPEIAGYFGEASPIQVFRTNDVKGFSRIGVRSVPTTIVVDRRGRVRVHRSGLVKDLPDLEHVLAGTE